MSKKLNIYLVIFLSSVIAILGIFLIAEHFIMPMILFNLDVIETSEANQNAIFIISAIEAVAILSLCYLVIPEYFNWILGAIFFFMSFYTAIKLFDLPSTVLEALEIKEELKIQAAEEATRPTYFLLITTFIINLIIFYRVITKSIRPHEDTIVYVPKYYDDEEISTSTENEEEDLKNIENIKSALRKGSDIEEKKQAFLNEVCKELEASSGILYKISEEYDKRFITLDKSFAFFIPETKKLSYEFGEGLAGQVAKTKKPILSNKIPEGYITVVSGLGNASPTSIIITPLVDKEDNLIGVLEVSTFKKYSSEELSYLNKVGNILSNSISA